jgi:hypothetical protein
MSAKKGKTFAEFCKKNKIAKDSIRWVTLGDKTVKISIGKDDFTDGGWNLLSVGIVLALRQLGVELDVTIREADKGIEVIVEK